MDPSGNIVGTLIDVGFLIYDTAKFIKEPSKANAKDAGLSLAFALSPGLTGGSAAAKAITKANKGTGNVLKTKSGFTLTSHAIDLLGDDRFKGKLTLDRLDELMHSKDAIRVIDNRTGNINVYAKSEFSNSSQLRITVAIDGKRIVSVGFEPLKRINKFIDSGNFTRIK